MARASSPVVGDVPQDELIGQLVRPRFQVHALLGRGGMGEVWSATEVESGKLVAIKCLGRTHWHQAEMRQRLLREARAASLVLHPNILSALEVFEAAGGVPVIVMPLLEGESLGSLLKREGALSLVRTLEVMLPTVAGVHCAHQSGVIHRDLKPDNLFLSRELGTENIRVLDFGIAKLAPELIAEGSLVTGTGALLGTPAYMAPEQGFGERDLDLRVDVWALGVVLYECLSGMRPVEGDNLGQVIRNLLTQGITPLQVVAPDVPEEIGRLVTRMLARERSRRPATLSEVHEVLSHFAGRGSAEQSRALSLSRAQLETPIPASTNTVTLRSSEPGSPRTASNIGLRRWLYVVVCGLSPSPGSASVFASVRDALAEHARRSQGELTIVDEEQVCIAFRARGSASDAAAAAARSALELTAALPLVSFSVHAVREPLSSIAEWSGSAHAQPGQIFIDDHVAGLLDGRFVTERSAHETALLREEDIAQQPRPLLGRPSPTVGRERELSAIDALLEEVRREGVSRAVLVTAAPGVGKSRLRQEVLARLHGFQIWSSHGDAAAAGAPLRVAARLVRSACKVDGSLPSVHDKIRGAVSSVIHDAEECRKVSEFLAELAGAPTPEPSAALAAARRDAPVMAEQVRSAWETFVDAAAALNPILMVLEDLHWGDPATIKLLDRALRRCKRRPLGVLAFARPELLEQFPRIWQDRALEHVRLPELAPRACERLVDFVLGSSISETLSHRLVELSGGNALYLEELIRSAASGHADGFPASVIAMVQARLDELAPPARRLLQAASVFGETFWLEGARALLGTDDALELNASLQVLLEAELVEEVEGSRFTGRRELTFRHALVQEAAYISLPDADLRAAHGAAAGWLIESDEKEAFVLAEHLERAGLGARAVPYYLRSTLEALRANDYNMALSRSQRGQAAGAVGEERRQLQRLAGEAHGWRGDFAACVAEFQKVIDAVDDLTTDPVSACTAIGWYAFGNSVIDVASDPAFATRAAEHLNRLPTVVTSGADYLRAAFLVGTALYFQGDCALANGVVERAERADAEEPRAAIWRQQCLLQRARFRDGDPWKQRQCLEEASRHFEEAQDVAGEINTCGQAALSDLDLACPEAALQRVERVLELADRFDLPMLSAHASCAGALAAAQLGRRSQAEALIERCDNLYSRFDNEIFTRYGRVYTSAALRVLGDSAAAEARCREILQKKRGLSP